MKNYIITLETNKGIRQYAVECNNSTITENHALEMFLKYEDIKWEDNEKLISAEIRTL